LQQTALKRQGNAHNVCGQLAITRGDHEGEAKTHFKAALDAFEAADDTRNCALLCCNLAHLDRIAAFETRDDAPLLLHDQRGLLAQAIGWYEKALRLKGLRIHYGSTYHSVWAELAATYASLARVLFDARMNGSLENEDPELISDLLGKALLLYQQCNQDADTLTPPQQRMWIDVLILSAKDLLYQVQQGNASNKKLLQRRTENAIGHLSQAMLCCLQWQTQAPLEDAFASVRLVLEAGMAGGMAAMPPVKQALVALHKCVVKLSENWTAESPGTAYATMVLAELQHLLKVAVKVQEDNKKVSSWKDLYLRSLRLELSDLTLLQEVLGDAMSKT